MADPYHRNRAPSPYCFRTKPGRRTAPESVRAAVEHMDAEISKVVESDPSPVEPGIVQ
jgi:hypothetical protein